MALNQTKYKKLKWRGVCHERAEYKDKWHFSPNAEKVFVDKWKKENARISGINGGYGALELLLNKNKTHKYFFLEREVTDISQRDVEVATTVIQWLGTNCGKCFLHECEQEIAHQKELAAKKFNAKWNKYKKKAEMKRRGAE